MRLNNILREGDVILIPRCLELDYENAPWITMNAVDHDDHCPANSRREARECRHIGDVVAQVVKYCDKMIRVKIKH